MGRVGIRKCVTCCDVWSSIKIISDFQGYLGRRLAPEQIHAPQAVCHVAQERQPGPGTTRAIPPVPLPSRPVRRFHRIRRGLSGRATHKSATQDARAARLFAEVMDLCEQSGFGLLLQFS
jgi:hypothetical protein